VSSRILTQSDRDRRIAQRRLGEFAGQLAAIGALARHARGGGMTSDRAIAIVEAVVQGYAIPHWVVTLEGGAARLTITVSPDAPAPVRALLEHATIATLGALDGQPEAKGGGSAA
jgi:hypothetical protein